MDYSYLFEKSDLIATIVQDNSTKEVLMLAYSNAESLSKMIETGYTWFYSRSRKQLWNKGETSGNKQKVVKIITDCDTDTLLVLVDTLGPACHTGEYSCFFNVILENGKEIPLNPNRKK